MVGCSLHLTQLISMSGRKNYKDKKKREVICGNSWFTNYCTVEAMDLDGFHYFGQVKTGHSRIPKTFLEEEMAGFCPGSWVVLEHLSPSGMPMVCIGYKYNQKRVLTFIMSKGCGGTYPGPPYRVTWTKENGEKIVQNIARPNVVTDYFHAAGAIDHHNHSRQGTLQLEEKWVTQCGYFCIFTTFVGMNITDAWMVWRYYIQRYLKDKPNKEKHPDWNVGMPEFAERLAFNILEKHSQEALLKRRKCPPPPTPSSPPDSADFLTSPSSPNNTTDDSSTRLEGSKNQGFKHRLHCWGSQLSGASRKRQNRGKKGRSESNSESSDSVPHCGSTVSIGGRGKSVSSLTETSGGEEVTTHAAAA